MSNNQNPNDKNAPNQKPNQQPNQKPNQNDRDKTTGQFDKGSDTTTKR